MITVAGGDFRRMRILQMITLAICKGEEIVLRWMQHIRNYIELASVQAMYI